MTTSKLPAYAFPGGYPIMYLEEGNVYCADCADSSSTATIYWEGSAIECDECSKMIESAYGEDS